MMQKDEVTGEIWYDVDRLHVRGGVYHVWRIYRNGKFLRTELTFDDHDPDDPTPVEMAA